MVTPSPFWDRHRDCDQLLVEFIRNSTSVDIDPTPFAVDPGELDRLCAYPLVFLHNLTDVKDARTLANIQEYLQRGGFLHIEVCSFVISRLWSFSDFLRAHAALFARLLPGCELRLIPSDHAIFRSCFPLEEASLPVIPDTDADPVWQNVKQSFYGVYRGSRLASLISLRHLQCGWNRAEIAPVCMKQLANVYVYVLSRPAE